MLESKIPVQSTLNSSSNYPTLVCDEDRIGIQVDDRTVIDLKDDRGKITTDRFPWIRQFLCVRSVTPGYEVLYHLNNSGFGKWSIDSDGRKIKFYSLDDKSLTEIETEFDMDLKTIYPHYRASLEQQKKADELYQKAKQYQNIGQHSRAEACYYRAIVIAPNKHQYLQALATCLSIEKKFSQALDVYLFLAAKQPERELDVWHFKHKLLTYLKNYQDEILLNNAISVFKRIIEISNSRSSALDLLGELYWYKQNKTKAVQLKALAATENVLPPDKIRVYHPETNPINESDLRLPDFLVIGPQKSGTTALYQYISDHPQVYPASQKEIFFFDLKYKFGIDWYKSHFPVFPEKHFISGEASATYFNSKVTPQRIAELLPDIKLIFILRDPVERAISDYHMKVRDGQESRDIETALLSEIEYLSQEGIDFLDPGRNFFKNHKGYVRNGLYYFFLKNYFNCLQKTNILTIIAQQLLDSPKSTMKDVFEFLKLERHIGSYPKVNQGNYSKKVSNTLKNELLVFFEPKNKLIKSLINIEF